MYIDLLLRWNARVNLTAVRDPEDIVTRHFGESLFAAQHLFPWGADSPDRDSSQPPGPPSATPQLPSPHSGPAPSSPPVLQGAPGRLLDVGSGAGFPGLPIKIWSPRTPVTLVESQHKKVAFLREVIRALTLTDIDVFSGRAEHFPEASAAVVTLRAVERFGQILPTAAARLAPRGTLALLIGQSQADRARQLLPQLAWHSPLQVPNSTARILLVGITGQCVS